MARAERERQGQRRERKGKRGTTASCVEPGKAAPHPFAQGDLIGSTWILPKRESSAGLGNTAIRRESAGRRKEGGRKARVRSGYAGNAALAY